MKNYEKFILPVSLILISLILGGSFYLVQKEKQDSIERQQKLKIELEKEKLNSKKSQKELQNYPEISKVLKKKKEEKQIIKNKSIGNLYIEKLIGYWFVPHAATINIQFYRNKTFIFYDYNSVLEKNEVLKGKYSLNKGVLTLFYYDRPKQSFKFYKGKNGDTNFYIKSYDGSYYFVKGVNGYNR